MTAATAIHGLVEGQALPLVTLTVAPSQVNALGHLRASEYVRLFDEANTSFYTATGLGDENLIHGNTSSFLMDLHTCYLAELRAGDAVRIAAQVLDVDGKRLRIIYQMTTATDGRLAATCELAIINMDMGTRRPVAWSAAQRTIFAVLTAAHDSIAAPPQAGRAIGALAHKP